MADRSERSPLVTRMVRALTPVLVASVPPAAAGWDFVCEDGVGPGQVWNRDVSKLDVRD